MVKNEASQMGASLCTDKPTECSLVHSQLKKKKLSPTRPTEISAQLSHADNLQLIHEHFKGELSVCNYLWSDAQILKHPDSPNKILGEW